MSINAPGKPDALLLYRPGEHGWLTQHVIDTWQFWTGHLVPWHYVAFVLVMGYGRHRLIRAQEAREFRARSARAGRLDQNRRH